MAASGGQIGRGAEAWAEASDAAAGDESGAAISFHGDWITANLPTLDRTVLELEATTGAGSVTFDLSQLGRMDTAGAWLVHRLSRELQEKETAVTLSGVHDDHARLLERIATHDVPCDMAPREQNAFIALIEDLGLDTTTALTAFARLVGFIGMVAARFAGALLRPRRLRLTPIVHQMEHVGLRALPIVGLISFLIGAVIVNQGAIQLRKFGGEVFVVDMLAFSVLRELGILLTAIIIAGRSGSAFAAEIGSMKLHEEIDAMQTIGLDPFDTLVMPRVIALMIMLPILTFYADLMGLVGGGLMAWIQLDISPVSFVVRLNESAEINAFMVGMIKAPFFAFVIAICGCFEGLSVKGSAESLGRRTTMAVVESIFLVIVLNALFAVFFTQIGW